jgi:hypothetical protein
MIGGTLYSAGTGSKLCRIVEQAKLGCLEKLDRALILSESATRIYPHISWAEFGRSLSRFHRAAAFIGSSEQKSCEISATL